MVLGISYKFKSHSEVSSVIFKQLIYIFYSMSKGRMFFWSHLVGGIDFLRSSAYDALRLGEKF